MRHFLVPLDGSGFGETALAFAAALAERRGRALDLVTVHPSTAHPDISATMSAGIETWSRTRAQVYLEGMAEQARRRFNIELRTTVLEGGAATAIADYALANPPELIVMTTHGRSGPSRLFLGSVTDRLVRELHYPFILVRPSTSPAEVELPAAARVLVPLDGSPLAESVLDEVERLVSPALATLHLVRVVEPVAAFPIGAPMPLPPMEPELIVARWAAAKEYLEGTAWKLRQAGWRVEYEIVTEWHAATVVLRYAEAHECDLIAIATRGRGGVQRLFLGSVTDKVIRGAATPVLVVNPAAGAFSRVLGERSASAPWPAGMDVGVLQGAVNAGATW
jgi:nucleotide-binding universal stress UspA family protein